MQVDKIFFDMDGVLADFCKGAAELGGYVWQREQGHVEISDTTLWDAVRSVEGFYLKLDIVPGSEELFSAVHKKYGEKVEVLTGIPKPHRNIKDVEQDKITWMHERLAPGIIVNECNKEDKWKYCHGAGSILIDDMLANIEAWRAAGGTGILFENAEDAFRQLQELGIM